MRRLALLLLVAPACLSRPEGRDQPEAKGAWPPAGVDIIAARVVDQDQDTVADLLLASSTNHVYLLLGTRAGIGAGYHADVATESAPLAIAFGDVSGDGDKDLVALEASGSGGLLEAFRTKDLASFDRAWGREVSDLVTLSLDHASVDVLDLEDDGNPDVYVSDQLHGMLGRSIGATEISFNAMTFDAAPPFPSGFDHPVSAYTVPAAEGGLHLVVAQVTATGTYAQIAAGQTIELHELEHEAFRGQARCDLDGDRVPELIGGFGAWATDRPWPDARTLLYTGGPNFGEFGELAATVCERLDHDAADHADVAKLFRAQDGELRVEVLPDVVLTEAPPLLTTSRTKTIVYPLPGSTAKVMVGGDFNGDGDRELLVIARDGAITCLTLDHDALTPCAP